MEAVILHLKYEVEEMKRRFFISVKEEVKLAVKNLRSNKVRDKAIQDNKLPDILQNVSDPQVVENMSFSKIRYSQRVLNKRNRQRKCDTTQLSKEHCQTTKKLVELQEQAAEDRKRNVTHLLDYYNCELCQKKFTNRKLFNNHVLNHLQKFACDPPLSFSCPVCEKEHDEVLTMLNHLKNHKNTKNPATCKKCGENFETLNSLTSHYYLDHFETPESVYKCIKIIIDSCNKENSKRQRYKSKIYICDDCGETFNHKTIFNSHTRIHNISINSKERRQENRKITNSGNLEKSKEEEPKSFNCPICQEEFETEHGVKMHFIHHTGSEILEEKEKVDKVKGMAKSIAKLKNIYKCKVCSETFFRIFKYRKHIIENHQDNRELRDQFCLNCPLCGESFNFNSKLRLHFSNLHGIFLQCPICAKNCSTKETFINHIEESHSENGNDKFVKYQDGFLCKMCGATVRSHGKIIHHFLTHHSQKTISCDICASCFAFEKDLLRHKTLVHLDKTFCCEECGKQFKTKRQLKSHKLTHLEIDKKKRIQCKECGKTFANEPTFRCHYTACHTDEKHFKCNVCGKAFGSAPTLHIHKIKVCEKEKAKEATCPICLKNFPNYILLCYHKANVHKYGNSKDNFCHLCNKNFDSSSCLYSHNKCYHTKSTEQLEKIDCSICGTRRPNKNALFEHMLTHGEEKPFECLLCGEKFKQRCGFYQHRKIKHKNEKDTTKLKVDLEMIKQLKKKFNIDETNCVFSKWKGSAETNPKSDDVHDIIAQESIIVEKNVPQTTLEIVPQAEDLFDLHDVLAAIDGHEKFNDTKQVIFATDQEKCSKTDLCEVDFSLEVVPEAAERGETLPYMKIRIDVTNEDQIAVTENNKNVETVFEGSNFSDVNEQLIYHKEVIDPAEPGIELPSVEYYEDIACDPGLEDLKPFILESNTFPEDPYPIQLKIQLRKLKEYKCFDCDQVYFTQNHFNVHQNSKRHKLAAKICFLQNGLVDTKISKQTSKNTERINMQGKRRGEVKRKKLYACPYCEEGFSSMRKYNDHILLHKNPKQCLLCSLAFPYAPALVNHYNLEHNGENVFKCDLCHKGFLNSSDLERHVESHKKITNQMIFSEVEELQQRKNVNRRERSYTCDRCGKKLPGIKLYKEHLLQHNNEKHKCAFCVEEHHTIAELESHYNKNHDGKMPYNCQKCLAGFSLKILLDQHQKLVHTEKTNVDLTIKRDTVDGKFVCVHCGKRFVERRYFKYHLTIHSGREKKHVCDFCNKQFQTRTNLKLHRRTHTGERPYSCEHCDIQKSFISRSSLKKHVDSVHLKKIVVCEYCGKSFTSRDRLNIHHRSHTGEKPFSCNQCHDENVTFASATSLKKHIETVHLQMRMPCEVCGKLFRGRHNLKVHMRIHTGEKPYSCNFCPKTFYASTDLKKHSDAVHLRLYKGKRTPFQCSICAESFRTQTALDKHSGLHDPNRPFACHLCTCRFSFNSNLVFHKKNVHEKQGIVYCKKKKNRIEQLPNQTEHT